MDSSRAIQEQIDELAIKAKALIEVAKKESREMTEEEATVFDDITDKQVPALRERLATTVKREDAERSLTKRADRDKKYAALSDDLERPSRDFHQVLPINGQLPSDADSQRHVYVKTARLKAFKNERDAYDSGLFIKALWGRINGNPDVKSEVACRNRLGLDIQNTMAEGTGAAGGYLVPAPLANTLIEVRENVGVARRVCDIQALTSDTLTIPKRSGGLTVYAPGEAGSITTSDKSYSQVELISKKRAVATYISQELVDDALINVVDNVVSEMGWALADQEDKELIDGTGAGATYFGVRGLENRIGAGGVSQAATGHDTWPEIDLADVTAAIALLPERFDRNPVWICSRNFYFAVLWRLEMAGGGNVIANLQAGAAGEPRFGGYPVYFSSYCPTATAAATIHAFFGSFSMGVILGDRTGIRINRDDSVGFLSDLIALKATSRYDINVHEPGTASVAGAYVALKSAA